MNMRTRYITEVSSLALAALLLAPASASARQEEFKLLASDGAEHDQFGNAVAVSGDRAVVGAHNKSLPSGNAVGAAYVFDVRTGQELFKLFPHDPSMARSFGSGVSIDGNVAVIGAELSSDVSHVGTAPGAAYLFDVRTGLQLQKLRASEPVQLARFGCDVSLSGDRALIGAYNDEHLGVRTGSAYIFDTTTGQELFKLVAPDGEEWDRFGFSVSIDENHAVVGAYSDDDNGQESGSIYVFDVSTGLLKFKLLPLDGVMGDRFGQAVSVRGNLSVVGAPFDDHGAAQRGSVYVFDVSTGLQLRKLVLPSDLIYSSLGSSVSISGDRAAVGGMWEEMVHIFDVNTGQLLEQLQPSAGGAVALFGSAVALRGGTVVVGAERDDEIAVNLGAAYIFDAREPGAGYCFGSSGSGTPCPCGNDNNGSVPGAGCGNGVFDSGAFLRGIGQASVSDDSLVLITAGLEPNNTGLYLQGDSTVNGGNGLIFGDGLRCAGGAVVRLEVVTSDDTGASRTTTPLGTAGGAAPGDVLRYQCWYRTTVNPPCGVGVNEFNLSNGYEVLWKP